MAKLNSGTRVYGTATIDSNVTVGSVGAVSGQFHTITGNITQTSSGGAVYFNTTGNISAAIVNTSALNATGTTTAVAINSTGFINTSANVSAAIGSFGSLTSTGFINTSANVSAAIGSFDSITVRAAVTAVANGGTSGVGNIGATGATFNTVFAKATTAQYADLAEVYTSDNNYVPGTVLIFGGDREVTISTISHDPRIAGVVSTNPAYLMNDTETGVAVALTGRVPCQVLGPVEKGDRLVASQWPGIAQRLNPDSYEPGCIIGKALENLEESSVKTIEVVVGRV